MPGRIVLFGATGYTGRLTAEALFELGAKPILAGRNNLDSTGEPPFIREIFERFGPEADAAGVALVTAFGHDWVPGNLAGALALK